MDTLLKTSAGRLTEAGVRRILDLRRNEKRTYQDIAMVLGVSVGTVYNTCRARTHKHLTSAS